MTPLNTPLSPVYKTCKSQRLVVHLRENVGGSEKSRLLCRVAKLVYGKLVCRGYDEQAAYVFGHDRQFVTRLRTS